MLTRDTMPDIEKLPESNRRERLLSELDNTLFTYQDKIDLVLVLEGLKSVCSIEIVNPAKTAYEPDSENEYIKNTEEFNKSLNMLEELLKELDLPYHKTTGHSEEKPGEPAHDFVDFSVGKNQESLEALKKISAEPDEKKKQAEYGRIFEIPPTAVEAWATGRIKNIDTLPDEVKESEMFNFIYFAPSEDHWEEELEFVKRRVETIKILAPSLYAQTISSD